MLQSAAVFGYHLCLREEIIQTDLVFVTSHDKCALDQAAKKMEKELRLQIERLQEDKNYNDQMYREVRACTKATCIIVRQSRLEVLEIVYQ